MRRRTPRADHAPPGAAARRLALGGVLGLVCGAVVGVGLLAVTGIAVAHELASSDADPGRLIDATHVPPLLTMAGEPLALRYDIYCAAPGPDSESGAPCDAAGTVYVRPGQSGPFREIPLRLDPGAAEGRYVADLPADVARSPSGFSYYAVVRSNRSGASTTVPPAGTAAPQRSLPLGRAITVDLGSHAFGVTRQASARVATARWGSAPGDVGLEPGPELQPIGATSFDVDAAGTVTVLDEAKRRLLRFENGASDPSAVPVDVRGTMADIAGEPGGGVYVLESVGDAGKTPLLRRFAADGSARGAWHVAGRSASAVKVGPNGPVALEYPAGQWMPVASGGAGLVPAVQERSGRVGRPVGGGEIVVARAGDEARVALVGPGGVRRGWRIQSATPLGEIQLAEPFRNGLVVVLREYTDSRDEFEALVLDDKGIARRFSLDSTAWAETAPLARFRLRGSALYQLGSTPAGMFVDRFDLEVT